MANRKQRLGKILYVLLLCAWGLLLCYGAYYGLSLVWEYAGEFEASRPNHTMDAYVAELSQNLWDEGIAETVKAMPHEVQSDEEVAAHVRDMLSNGVSYVRRGGGGEGKAVYTLTCNGSPFGVVTIAEEEDYVSPIDLESFPWRLLPWSIRPWKVESESFDFNGLYSPVEIIVPRSYTVLLNGVRLGPEYIVERDIPFDVLKSYYERHEDLPTKVRYRVENVIGGVEAEFLDEDGAVFLIDPRKDDSQFIRPCSPEKLDRLADFTAGFVDKYLKYTSGVNGSDYGYKKLAPYLLAGSDLDNRMRDALDGLTWAHTESITVESARLNGALDLGEHYYLCDISSVATTFTAGKGETESVSNMRVIVRERNDDVRAVALELY